MPTLFTIDPRSGVPIYLQLVEQVKRSVALGVLSAGEQLPTVKQLSAELTVNPNTVARAYRELERDGVIETSPGRGSFIRGNGVAGAARQTLADVTTGALDRAVREARSIGLARVEVDKIFLQVLKHWYPDDSGSEARKEQ